MQMQPQFERTGPRFNNVQSGSAVYPYSLAVAKSQLLNNQALPLSGTIDINEVKSAQKQQKDADAQEKGGGRHVGASELMSIYKCTGPAVAGIGYGLIFKGGSVLFAVMMSLLASSLSVVVVNKIHKEDGPLSQGLVNWSGKLMGLFGKGQQHDRGRAGKEWSMVPVWGFVCGFAGLLEAMLNHAYSKKFPSPPVKNLMDKSELANKKGLVGTFYGFRSTCLSTMMDAKNWLKDELPKVKYFPRSISKMPKWLIEKMENDVHGNVGMAYFLGALIPCIGALVQSGIFAKIQERIDAKQATKDKHKAHAGKAHQSERTDANQAPQAQSGNIADTNVADKTDQTQSNKSAVKKDEKLTQKPDPKSDKQSQAASKEKLPNQQSTAEEKKTPASTETKVKPDHKTGQTPNKPNPDEAKATQAAPSQPPTSSSVIPDSRHLLAPTPKQKSIQGQHPNLVKPDAMTPSNSSYWNYDLWQQQFRHPQQPPFVFFKPPGY